MEDWTVIEPKDHDRIWQVALALLSQGPQQGGPATLQEALQRACAEFFSARGALRKGLRFFVIENGEETLRRVRVLENGSWVNEPAKARVKQDD